MARSGSRGHINTNVVAGDGLYLDTSNLVNFAKELKKATPKARAAFRRDMKAAAEKVAVAARRNSSWSTGQPTGTGVPRAAIPSTIKVKFSAARGSIKAKVEAGGVDAPHARLFEMGSLRNRGEIRHPVFGEWRAGMRGEKTRPFLIPAVHETYPEFRDAAVNAVKEFRGGLSSEVS